MWGGAQVWGALQKFGLEFSFGENLSTKCMIDLSSHRLKRSRFVEINFFMFPKPGEGSQCCWGVLHSDCNASTMRVLVMCILQGFLFLLVRVHAWQACTHACMYACMYACVYACACVFACVSVCMHACMHGCTPVCIDCRGVDR